MFRMQEPHGNADQRHLQLTDATSIVLLLFMCLESECFV